MFVVAGNEGDGKTSGLERKMKDVRIDVTGQKEIPMYSRGGFGYVPLGIREPEDLKVIAEQAEAVVGLGRGMGRFDAEGRRAAPWIRISGSIRMRDATRVWSERPLERWRDVGGEGGGEEMEGTLGVYRGREDECGMC